MNINRLFWLAIFALVVLLPTILHFDLDLGNFIISIFSSGFGALAAFYFNAFQLRNDHKKVNISSLNKAEYVLNKYSANNKIIKKYIDNFIADESIEYACDWQRIGVLDNKFPILEVEIHTLLFLVNSNPKCGIYIVEKFDKKLCEYQNVVNHALAYILTLDEKLYFVDREKLKYYEIIIDQEIFYSLLKELQLPQLESLHYPLCIIDKLSHEQLQAITINTGFTFNILDKILLAISENTEMMRILGERNQKYANYLENIERQNYNSIDSIDKLTDLIGARLFDELKLLTHRMLEVNKNTIYDCDNAAGAIAEFLEQH